MFCLLLLIFFLRSEQTLPIKEVESKSREPAEKHKESENSADSSYRILMSGKNVHIDPYDWIIMQGNGGIIQIDEPFALSSAQKIQYYRIKLRKLGRKKWLSKKLFGNGRSTGNLTFKYGFQYPLNGNIQYGIYHKNDGTIIIEYGKKYQTIEKQIKFGQGDILGCGLWINGGKKYVFFTKKDKPIASFLVPSDLNMDVLLYPIITMSEANHGAVDAEGYQENEFDNCLEMAVFVKSFSTKEKEKLAKQLFKEQNSADDYKARWRKKK